MKIWGLVLLLLAGSAHAEDLETLFDKTQSQAKSQGSTADKNSSQLADVITNILRKPTSEQNFFLRLIEDAKWNEALYQFEPSFKGSAFRTSEDGQALKALLMFNAGLNVAGLEKLFQVSNPKKIHFQILSHWKQLAPANHPAWSVARVSWNKNWTDVFGVATEVRVRSADFSLATNPKLIEELSAISPVDSREKALMEWNLAVQHGLKDDAKKAALIIATVMKNKNNPVPEDLMNLTAARLLYQNAYYDAALKYYDKVPKSSDYFFEAQEEKAWAYLRKRQPQDALAITQSLVMPIFAGQVGPESWFVRALAQLKTCDYPAALETLKAFPKNYKDRTIALEKLSKESNTAEVKSAIELIKSNSMQFTELAKISKNLPRGMVRDESLRQLVKTQTVLESETKAIDSLTVSLRDVASRAEFGVIKNQMGQRMEQARANTLARIKNLAKDEVEETKNILNKLHIVEAEIIQQVENASKMAKAVPAGEDVKKGSTGSAAQDVLKFPFDNEFWFDEVTNYKVDLKKACQAKKD
jgi:tetratricopeptide (TPR) repeat protein